MKKLQASVAVVGIAVAFLLRFAFFPALSVSVLDVGQGDAALVSCGFHQTLVDGGPDESVLAKIGESVLPFDRRIDRIVVTHSHRDHFVGLVSVIERYRVGELLIAHEDRTGDPEYSRLLSVAASKGVPVNRIAAGDSLPVSKCGKLEVLWPLPGAEPDEDPNAESIVLRLLGSSRNSRALLMGDATSEVELALVESGISLRSEFLKVSHHGSRHSSAAEFVNAVSPQVAVISSGKNRHGHPAYIVVERLRRAGAEVLRTDLYGTVEVIFRKDMIRLK